MWSSLEGDVIPYGTSYISGTGVSDTLLLRRKLGLLGRAIYWVKYGGRGPKSRFVFVIKYSINYKKYTDRVAN